MVRSAWLVAALLAVAACTSQVATTQRPYVDRDLARLGSPVSAGAGASLFAGDAAVLSDETIARIIDYEYKPPRPSRIALMPFGREIWSHWSEELSLATEQVKRDVIGRLTASPHVYDASYLPSILIPAKRSVPHLREAGARFQADLLLVYRSHCRTFERHRRFATSRSRAFCGVEAVLLDIRTGLVPFTSVASRSFEIEQSDSDLSFRETIVKAQLAAVTQALSDVSTSLVKFLNDKS